MDAAPPPSDTGMTLGPDPDHAIVDRPLFKESSKKSSPYYEAGLFEYHAATAFFQMIQIVITITITTTPQQAQP